MGSLLSVLDVARDGMLAQSTALDVTGQNVTNAGTPGYARRIAQLETVATPGAFGSVRVTDVTRAFDSFAEQRSLTESGKQNAASARSTALANAESILAPSGVPSISDQVSSFFSSMNALAQNPSDPASRASALAAAQNLSQGISTTANQLADAQQGLYTKAQGVASEINQRLSQIGDLNRRIVESKGLGNTPADLIDQRDQLVRDVGDRMGVQAIDDPSGAVTLLSSGTALVNGDQAATVSVSLGAGGAMAVSVTRKGGAPSDVTANVTSGTLGGLREARDVDLAKTAADLDQFAYGFANDVNAVHTTGFGLDGQTGRPLFAPPASATGAARGMAVDPAVLANPNAIATASSASSVPGGNDIAIAIAQLSEKAQGSASSPAEAFAAVAAGLGTAKQSADAELTLRNGTVAQANTLRDSASGVSLDEEMVNLTKYQRAFEASQKVLSTVDELLDGLIRSV